MTSWRELGAASVGAIVACACHAGLSSASMSKPAVAPATRVELDASKRPVPLLLVAENEDPQTLAFLYGLCGWLATTEGVERRYSPIFLLTSGGTHIMNAGAQLERIANLAQESGDAAEPAWSQLFGTQQGLDKLLPRRVESYRCGNVPSVPGNGLVPVVLGVSFATIGRPGLRYLTIVDGHPPRRGFFDLQGPKLADDARQFSAESLFDIDDALAVQITNRTRTPDRCTESETEICVNQRGEAIVHVDAAHTPFFAAEEIAIAPPEKWRVESIDGVPSVRLVRPHRTGTGVGIRFLDSGRYRVHVELRARQRPIRRVITIPITVIEQDWLVASFPLRYALACRRGTLTAWNAVETLMRFIVFDLSMLDVSSADTEQCTEPPREQFATQLRSKLATFLVLDRDHVEALVRELRATISEIKPFQMDDLAWREISAPLVSSTSVRALFDNGVESPVLDRIRNRLEFGYAHAADTWCAALARGTAQSWPEATPALPPSNSWIHRCRSSVSEVMKAMLHDLVPASQVARGFLVERTGDGWPLLDAHEESSTAYISFDGDVSTEAWLAHEASTRRRQQQVSLRLQLLDGRTSDAVPVTVTSAGGPIRRLAQTSVGINSGTELFAEVVMVHPRLSELLYLGYGASLRFDQTDRVTIFGRIGLPLWCHWVHRSAEALSPCRPTALLVPYIDLGADIPVRADGDAPRFHIAGGISIYPGESMSGPGVDFAYRRGPAVKLGYRVAW